MASEGTPPGEPSPHTLHYFPFSIYCIMVRFAFHLGIKLNPETAPAVNVRLVDLHQQEHLLEEFLTVNPKGQVSICISSHVNPSCCPATPGIHIVLDVAVTSRLGHADCRVGANFHITNIAIAIDRQL